MKQIWTMALVLAVWCGSAAGAEAPWKTLYSGAEATGAHVMALWQFQPGAEAADHSGRGHTLTLRGASRFAPDGLFGACLESFDSDDKDTPCGATAKNHPALTPKGAFTVEMWIRPKPELAAGKSFMLLDKQYYRRDGDPRANKDYQIALRPASGGRFMMDAYIGHGDAASHYPSAAVALPTGEWTHLAFAYDGAGLGRFFVNGRRAGQTRREGAGPVAPGPHPLVIGGRVGSTHTGFPGYIDQVRLIEGAPAWMPAVAAAPPAAGAATGAPAAGAAAGASLAVAGGRTVFQRLEADAAVTLAVVNNLGQPLQGLRVSASLDGSPMAGEPRVPDVASGGRARVRIPVDTALKPGLYALKARLEGQSGGTPVTLEAEGRVTIVARPLPHVLPVVMWGIPEMSYKVTDVASLKAMGFTHTMLRETDVANFPRIWEAEKPVVPSVTPDPTLAQMDGMLAEGLRYVISLSPARWVMQGGPDAEARQARFQRVNRSGEPYGRSNPCGNFPEIQRFCYDVGESISQVFGQHPALDGAMIHTEYRDGSGLCFHPHDLEAYRADAGRDIPTDAVDRGGVPTRRRREFVPFDGIVADDHPIASFYRWFWSRGDGWNALHSQVHRGLKAGAHEGFWTFFDPATRCPPVWGSGGEVDVLSQWTYTYPDPPRMGLATDELFAMAAGRPGQRVMKMTQAIWYRDQTAPNLPEKDDDRAAWERSEPEAKFITIAPDHLREAFWLKLSRPVQGIMVHGSHSLGMGDPNHTHSYRYTNPETRQALAEVTHAVVAPLGPALLQIPDPLAEVAVLQSFTSTVFGTTATWGWGNGWMADVYLALQWARLQPRVLYEEAILRDGLDGLRVLVLPDCPVLPRGVCDRILAFQREGGVVVADSRLAKAITPDILMSQPKAAGAPDLRKASLQALGEQLRQELAPVLAWQADSSDPDMIVRRRQYGDAEYLFAVNDKRTYGDYVGHHRLVMEKGLPHQATLSIRRPAASVYDLLDSRAVAVRATATGVEWEASLGPGEGRVYMVTSRPLADVRLAVAQRRPADRAVAARASVVDPDGNPLAAVVPVRV
ncbi:MAG: hypothetical protein GX595_14570, partial [Lentisphaerae bacterium]|nr:hypothetical protein [Lentisphaerota bacterium]